MNDQSSADSRQLVSIVAPAFNESAILAQNLEILADYLASLEDRYRWEIVIVNDGSSDGTGELAEQFAATRDNVKVIHHKRNYGLGQALKFGISNTSGDYIVVLDIDLSYSPDHVEALLDKLQSSKAKLVLASPYMKGGQISNVPWLRKMLSVGANWFLSLVAHGNLSTLTCMVRGYDGDFARSLVLRSTGMDFMPESVYKSMILRAGIAQIPAHLDWGLQAKSSGRSSSMRILKQMMSTLLSGFIFRPFMFFILPGLLLFVFSAWVNFWMIMHFFDALQAVPPEIATDKISWAVAEAYDKYPHTFIVGLLSLMVAIQLLSLGILSLQNKTYFEEVFYLGWSARRLQIMDRERRM
ncbi:MAG: glycosyltransferase family 2 protein [Woeseiaceae bacterium]|nr:glycosyltransferase family 2 protein [Woeseiaceae bacterium]